MVALGRRELNAIYFYRDYALIGTESRACADPETCAMEAKRPQNGEQGMTK